MFQHFWFNSFQNCVAKDLKWSKWPKMAQNSLFLAEMALRKLQYAYHMIEMDNKLHIEMYLRVFG